MKKSWNRWKDHVNWDRWGMRLSVLCALHCLLTPLAVGFVPLLSEQVASETSFHLLIALLVIPVGAYAFYSGYQHHRKKTVVWFGMPGLLVVALIPWLARHFGFENLEAPWMVAGSSLLITAHWINQRACRHCRAHPH